MLIPLLMLGALSIWYLESTRKAAAADRDVAAARLVEENARRALAVAVAREAALSPQARVALGGPPGLLLRREPEIRGLLDGPLADYVAVIERYGEANLAIEWRDSRDAARAERLLRVMVRSNIGARSNAELLAVGAWIKQLLRQGMPLTVDEQALATNIAEEVSWRGGQGR